MKNDFEIVLIGAGGHARVVFDTFCQLQRQARAVFLDDDKSLDGQEMMHQLVHAPAEKYYSQFASLPMHIAIGSNLIREQVCDNLSSVFEQLVTITSPSAHISQFAEIDIGCFIATQAIVAANACVGKCCIINHAAIIDHDCKVGDFSHVAPGAVLGGNVTVGKRVLIGANATVLPGISIADDCVIGAGAVVTNNTLPATTLKGVPAK